jgi:anti-sigma regulatory factor (Ser/Thr protein kinase)
MWGIALALAELGAAPRQHEVLYYDTNRDLGAVVAGYVAAGLSDDETVLLIATRAHLAAIEAVLTDAGVDVPRARAAGAYLALDAAETLASFMVDGSPDSDRFMSAIGGLLDRARAGGTAVRAFGEMVALLWEQGDVSGAVAVESLWNDLAARQRFSLLCAYPSTALDSSELSDLNDVCRLHTAVRPLESYASPPPPIVEPGRTVRSGVFVAVRGAAHAARRFVDEALTSWGDHDLVEDGTLIVSELATNAIIHGGSPFRVSIERTADVVRIAVEDAGPGLPVSTPAAEGALNGRGITIVEELARRWGCDGLDEGKVLWVELASPAR